MGLILSHEFAVVGAPTMQTHCPFCGRYWSKADAPPTCRYVCVWPMADIPRVDLLTTRNTVPTRWCA